MKGLRFVKMLVGTKCFNVQNYSMLWSVWRYSSRTKALTWTISLVKFLTKYFNFWGFVPLVVKFRRNGSMAQMVQVPFCIPWQLFCYSRFCSKPVWDTDALVDLVFLHDCGLWWELCWAVSLLLHCKPVNSMEGGEYLFYLSWGSAGCEQCYLQCLLCHVPLIGKTFLKPGLGNFGKHLGWNCQTVVLHLLAPFIQKL